MKQKNFAVKEKLAAIRLKYDLQNVKYGLVITHVVRMLSRFFNNDVEFKTVWKLTDNDYIINLNDMMDVISRKLYLIMNVEDTRDNTWDDEIIVFNMCDNYFDLKRGYTSKIMEIQPWTDHNRDGMIQYLEAMTSTVTDSRLKHNITELEEIRKFEEWRKSGN